MKKNLLICILLMFAASFACSSDDDSSSTTTTTPTCRNYATAATISGNLDGSFTGEWDEASLTNTWKIFQTNNTDPIQILAFKFSSKSDFVESVSTIGRPRFATLTTTEGTNTPKTATYTYNSTGQVATITESSKTTTFSAWDSSLRPTAGTITQTSGCTNYPTTFTYDDTNRVVTEVESKSQGTSCSGSDVDKTTTQTFDANASLIKSVEASGSTTSTINIAVSTTAELCK